MTNNTIRQLMCAVSLALSAGTALAADMPSPTPSSVDLTKARTLIEKKDWNAAITELERLGRRDKTDADVQNLLGYSYRNAGQVDKAFTAYNNALRLDPKHKGAHEYIGVAYLLAKQPDKAKEHLAQLKVICGGESCEEYQDLAKAIAAYKP
ncbi:MAG TPA: tetratricopeptide repeat protein [Burkholderiaceae bacterium]|nr:tetratricopeptide repeat protein [Burkholderiaceae bacterium]